MNSSIVRRAEAARFFGIVVMLAGLVPVLLFLAQSVLVSVGTGHALGALSPFHGWPALESVTPIPAQLHAGLVIAVLGFAVIMIGAGIARRQAPVLAAARRDREDGLRRARQYYDGERIEPYIGPGLPNVAEEPTRWRT